ncbi:MAG: hypothetical protein IPL55_03345 [Saprospiraceae bacterium]|nr:hypothetical protein [Saprospiraceae bacterium]
MIRVPLDYSLIFERCGAQPKDDGRKKGGLKAMLIDAHADTPAFVKTARPNVMIKLYQYLNLPSIVGGV